MRPTKRLILALRETAQRLRDPRSDYDWNTSAKCNCGQLTRSLGIDEHDIQFCGMWTNIAENTEDICRVTQRPLVKVMEFLLQCGLERNDFHEIEYAGKHYKNAKAVAQWFDQKADELERRRGTEKESERL